MHIKPFIICCLLPTTLIAGSFQPNESDYYYKLGGSSNLYVPPINNDQTITIVFKGRMVPYD